MGTTNTRTHGVVGKAWSYKGQVINIEAIDQIELTVDSIERSFTFHTQKDFDQFFKDLKPVATTPTAAPSPPKPMAIKSEPAPAKASQAPSRNLRPIATQPSSAATTKVEVEVATTDRTPTPLDSNGLSIPDINSSDPLAYMKGVLMESVEKLRKDKGYIGQAKEITNAANSFVSTVLMEMKIRKGV